MLYYAFPDSVGNIDMNTTIPSPNSKLTLKLSILLPHTVLLGL
ncbi:hypothetical protein MTBBW1_1880004 [Desulfamplus magnetovallimortis]|uniref:Uncharacterized protein n=1 Tax=Desulfamplus magnetovallimortis TaxID=1246637 RepID=A0A1W1HAR1_9BACT|nr:hypothetical protein MTBBW1_1880004 [Desulfamplus magnetovallimortis]